MTITAKSIVKRATDILQDQTSVAWPAAELVRWLNDGQREVLLYRPDAITTHASIALSAGTRQVLPASGIKLIDVINNTAGTKSAVRLIKRELLDQQVPGWHGLAGVTEIKHFMYDQRDPRAFYVYPPAAGGGAAAVNAVYSTYPTDVTEPADGSEWDDVAGNISLPDIYSNVLLDYMLYRAYSKDDSDAGNVNRAVAHYSAFTSALGGEAQATVTATPNAAAAAAN